MPLVDVNPVGFTPYAVTPDGRFLVTSVASQEGQPSVAFDGTRQAGSVTSACV